MGQPLQGKQCESGKAGKAMTPLIDATSLVRMPQHRSLKVRALGLLAARVIMVALATLLVWLLALSGDRNATYPPSPLLASLALLPVNLASIWLMTRLLRSEGTTLRNLFGFRSDRRLGVKIG